MKKVIVTGANGFIGTALLQVLSRENIMSYAIVRNQKSNIDQIASLPNVKIIYCDLNSIDNLPTQISDRDIDVCIHLAWEGSYGDLRSDYDLQVKNILYSLKMADVSAKMGIKRFVGVGTLAEKDVLNFVPEDGVKPNGVSMYGISKVTAHYMLKTECAKLNMEFVWCILSNTYGIANTTNNFVNMACKKMLTGERAAFSSGEQMYDFVYVTDTARALYAAANLGRPYSSYYLGSGHARKLKEYIMMIRDAIDPRIELFLGEVPYNGKTLSEKDYDITKLKNDTGFDVMIPFEEGISITVEYLKTNKG